MNQNKYIILIFFFCISSVFLSLQPWTQPRLRALCVLSLWIRVIRVWMLQRRVTWTRCVSASVQPTSPRVAALHPLRSRPNRAAVNAATGLCASSLSACRVISATRCSSAHAGTRLALSDDARPSYPPALLRKSWNQTASSSGGSVDQMLSAGTYLKTSQSQGS